jgi:hypothetical protein
VDLEWIASSGEEYQLDVVAVEASGPAKVPLLASYSLAAVETFGIGQLEMQDLYSSEAAYCYLSS